MTEIVTYEPRAGDGDAFMEVIRLGIENCDGFYKEIMIEDLGPALCSILERRAAYGLPDVDFFAYLSGAFGALMLGMPDFFCHSGEKQFAQMFLKSVCALMATQFGVDVVPTREDVSATIRSTMN